MNILLTLDYELFNGLVGGTVEKCLITPMNKLEEILDKYHFQVTLFVDACFLLSLKKYKQKNPIFEADWVQITSQLRRFSDKGHSIQLHLHPQWLNAKYYEGKWHSDLNLYKLADLTEYDAICLFFDGCELIKSITGKSPVAFRAGDYCAQTFKSLTSVLKQVGISIDSSVLRNKRVVNDREWFDYLNIPKDYNYRFSDSVTNCDNKGHLVEVSIPTYKHHPIDVFYRKKKIDKSLSKTWGDGESSTGGKLDKGLMKYINRLKLLLNPIRMSASIDGISATYLEDIYKYEKRKKSPYMMIMGHPKTFTPLYLQIFEEFVSKMEADDKSITIENFVL